MCFSDPKGETDVVIGGKGPGKDQMLKDLGIKPNPNLPPPAPDITSELLDSAARNEKAWARTKRGRRSTFLTGQSADSAMTPPTTLLGG